MRPIATLLAGTFLAAAFPATASAQDVPAAPAANGVADPNPNPPGVDSATASSDEIVVTARKREESLLDVPVAITAVSGETLERRGITSVRQLSGQTPGLNITSDGSGRAFVAIRGVGVTLVQTVQPGVGLFVDGIYRPNTAYLNSPLLDVERVEVLRGPQGTLYGKNTLGGAINVITRQPGNQLSVRAVGSYAGPDDSWLVAGSVSGPIVADRLQVRIAASHQQRDGFLTNTLIGGRANYYNTDTVNATIRAVPVDGVTLTINGYQDWIVGANTPYARVTGPTDYSRSVQFNSLNRTHYRYRGVNARLEVPIDSIDTNVTLLTAYDDRASHVAGGEGDFGPADIVRLSGHDKIDTRTAELRFDSKLSEQLSSLIGFFYSRENTAANTTTSIIPFGINNNAVSATHADTYAAFGTLFYRPSAAFELALGLRYDHEDRRATGGTVIAGTVVPIAPRAIVSDQVEPRVTATYHWTPEVMTYASISRGYRGGGFNAPSAPAAVRTYRGDSAWTYEVGSRFVSIDRRLSISGDVFYNDYSHYIGLNSIAPASTGGLVTVDLNAGHVESYGAELEATFRPVRNWTVSGSLTLMHARLTDTSEYTAVTKRVLSSDRLTFQPDLLYSLSTDYTIPLGRDSIVLGAALTGKGKRLAATLNQTTPTLLDGYALVDASIAWRHGPVEVQLFANNLFNADYFESYIEKTTLALAGLPASDLGIVGDRRRVGIRARLQF
jgi:iron complex outermembrane recepter protein